VEESLRQRNRELGMLNRASQMLGSTLDLDQVLSAFLEEVRRLLDVIACSVWLADPETGELICRQATGPRSELVRGWRLAPGEGIAGSTMRGGESIIVPDTQADRVRAGIVPGEVVLSIDGTPVDPALDLTTVLNGRMDRDVRLVVADAAGKERTVVVRPVTLRDVSRRLYGQWLESSEKRVHELSGGKLGYLHVRGMSWGSFYEFERQLYLFLKHLDKSRYAASVLVAGPSGGIWEQRIREELEDHGH